MQLVQGLSQRGRSRPPLPSLLPSAACLGAAGATFLIGAAASLPPSRLVVAPVSLALFGALVAARVLQRRARLRADADTWISRGYESRAVAYAWRIDELISQRERRLLARSLRAIVRELDRPRPASAIPLNRRVLHPHRDSISGLATRVADLERPVSAAGILGVHRLLTSPGSVLYARPDTNGDGPDVAAELTTTLERLEAC